MTDAIPRRISAEPSDPGYRADHRDFQVFIDGDQPRCVVTADAALGRIWLYTLNDRQQLTMDPKTGAPEIRTMTGLVRIMRRRAKASA